MFKFPAPTLIATTFAISLSCLLSAQSVMTEKTRFQVNCSGFFRDDFVRISTVQPITPGFIQHGEKKRMTEAEKLYWDSMRLNTRYPPGNDFSLNKTYNGHDPILGRNFKGNDNNSGTPLDNALAISKSGFIISSINSNYTFYDTLGNALLPKKDFEQFRTDPAFISDPAFQDLSDVFYDPRVVYDPIADRFIIVFLFGNDPTNNRLILLFSKTNNPLDGWHLYKVNGNFGKPAWFDYPAIAVTQDELIITGNMFDLSTPNQFQGTIIVQMDKQKGYNGQTLDYQTWYPITKPGGEKIFTLYPCGDGQYNSIGPGIYLVGTDRDDDEICLVHLTNNMNSLNEQVVTYNIPWGTDIANPGDATQKTPPAANAADKRLDNGGARIRSAYYLDGLVHFVFSNNNGQGYSEIAYGRLDVNTRVLKTARLGMPGKDYSYPSITSFSNISTNKTALICFLASDPDIYPEIRIVSVDENMVFGGSQLVRQGDDWVNLIPGTTDRWGDYSTACTRIVGDSVQAWFSGCFGTTGRRWQTQVAVAKRANDKEDPKATTYNISLYPNPAFGKLTLDLVLENSATISLELYDMSGKFLGTWYEATLLKGVNPLVTIDISSLPSGVYTYVLKQNGAQYRKDKLLIGTTR